MEWINNWSGALSFILALLTVVVSVAWKFKAVILGKFGDAWHSVRRITRFSYPTKIKLTNSLTYGCCEINGPNCILREKEHPITQVISENNNIFVCQQCLEEQLTNNKWEVEETDN